MRVTNAAVKKAMAGPSMRAAIAGIGLTGCIFTGVGLTEAVAARKPRPAADAPAATPAAAAGTSTKDGVDAWQRGDYPAAVAIWRPLAAKGDADAAFNLAQAYKLGRGVPTDLAQAKTLYGQAARGGHPQGAANYGLLLFQDGDRANALPWIQKAAEAGDPRAQYVYGTALFNGDLVSRDWPRAYALMTRAAAAGLPQATTSLAQMDQFLSIADRQKGLSIAADLAAKPMPPIDRHQVTATGDDTPTSPASPPLSPVRPVQVAASTPAPLPPVWNTGRPTPPQPVAPPPGPAKAPHPAPTPKPEKAPKPAPAAPVAIAPVAGGRWKVQLGAYGSQAAAKTAWSQLSGKAAALRGLSPSYEQAGTMVRLRAAGLADKAGAEKACAAAKGAGAACFPVAP